MECLGVPLRRLRKRAALSPSRSADSAGWVEVARAQHGAAGSVSGVCDGWSPDVCVGRVRRMVTGRAYASARLP
jgi:hypothetical protein